MIPEDTIKALERELKDLSFGSVCLEVIIHDGKTKYRIIKTVSFVPDKPTSGQSA